MTPSPTKGVEATAAARSRLARVPGKVILAGEHSAVYGHPALLAALGVGVEVEVRRSLPAGAHQEGEGLTLDLGFPDGRISGESTWASALELGQQAARAWERFARDEGSFVSLVDLEGSGGRSGGEGPTAAAAAFARVALAETWWHWCAKQEGPPDAPPRNLLLRVDSQLPLGAGCGSSAAVASGVAIAFTGWLQAGEVAATTPVSQFEPLVHSIESRQHGHPSGVDGAMVLRGGVMFAERREDNWRLRPVADPHGLLGSLKVLFTGSRRESTGEVVAAVARRARGAPTETQAIFTEMRQATHELRRALASGDGAGLGRALASCQEGLKALGVVPDKVAHQVERLAALGCVDKVSGAGSLQGPGAGLLLLYDPYDAADDLIREFGYSELGGRLGGIGARLANPEAPADSDPQSG